MKAGNSFRVFPVANGYVIRSDRPSDISIANDRDTYVFNTAAAVGKFFTEYYQNAGKKTDVAG